ncbi:MAG: STAS domain-containing protein [Solirubrobacteraceae bacterium]
MSGEEGAAGGKPSDLVRVDISGDDDFQIARLAGEIDISNADQVTDALTRMPNTLHGLIIDLTELIYLDSAGVRMLYELGKRLSLRSQSMVVVSPAGQPPRRVLELTGVPERVQVVETLAEANQAVLRP